MKRLYIAVALIPVLVIGSLLLAGSAPAGAPSGYQPGPVPSQATRTMPLAGLNGLGVGYCVTIEGTDLRVDVPMHIIDPARRDKENKRFATSPAWERLSLDPGTITLEYRASVQNAFKLMAAQSGDPRLIGAAEKRLAFPELGDPVSIEQSTTTCLKSTCYGKGPGSGCKPTGCAGECADCVSIRVPSIQ